MTPLGAALVTDIVATELSAMFAEYGGLLDRIEMRSVAGEIYARATPLGGRGGPPPPWWVLGGLVRVVPALRRRMGAARRAASAGALSTQIRRWRHEQQPEIAAATAALRAVDLSTLDDAALDQHVDAAVALCRRALHAHFHLIPPYVVPLHELVVTCRQLLGWSTAQSLELVTGTSRATSRPAEELAALGQRIRDVPAARVAVQSTDADVAGPLTAADPELGAAFAEWCERHAFRCVNDDPGSPLYIERPWLLARLLRNAVEAADSRVAQASATGHEAAERARAGLSGADRERFERVLAAARDSYPVREETAYWAASLPPALIRMVALEIGRRLTDRGLLAQPEDAVYLDLGALRTALARRPADGRPSGAADGISGAAPADVPGPPADGVSGALADDASGAAADDLRARVRRARAERAWAAQHPGPLRIGPEPPALPDLRGLPQPARRLNEALLWAQDAQPARNLAPSGEPERGATLTGAPGSPGRYTGPVRVIRAEADFRRLKAGEVLVCPTTDPAWSVLFGAAGALVTDGGGLLSHAAIVAREHAIPAVVGAGSATSRLHDGDVVTVDGTAGRVVVERNPIPGTDTHRRPQ
jgi:pyruvate,water dikinase